MLHLAGLTLNAVADPVALVVKDPSVQTETLALADDLSVEIRNGGFEVRQVDFSTLCLPNTLNPKEVSFLVLPDASVLPTDAIDPILAYLQQGGDILALNAPMARRFLLRDGTSWVDRDTFRKNHQGQLSGVPLFHLEKEGLKDWERFSNDLTIKTSHEIVQDEQVGAALHVQIPLFNNWDTFASPELKQPFGTDRTLTTFMAKGGPQTTELAVEWTEDDGSRWIATVPLTDNWQFYVLQPEDFKFWQSVPARQNDHFRPQNARRIVFGIAYTHTPLRGDRHEYWVAHVATAARNPYYDQFLRHVRPPALEILLPSYKFYDATQPVQLQSALLPNTPLPSAARVQCVHPRPKAGGFDKGRNWRWEPILEARDARVADSRDPLAWRGAAGALLVHADGPYSGGVWASFGIDDGKWYSSPEALALIRELSKRMRKGVFLIDGGLNFYTYFQNQNATAGARLINTSREPRHITVRLTLASGERPLQQKEWEISVNPGAVERVVESFPLPKEAERGALAVTELWEGSELVDRAQHHVFCWVPEKHPKFVTIENGEFVAEGKRWRPHGVNYMPSSGIGTEDWKYFEQWLGAQAYDPEIVERDLRRVRDLGMNSVSIFIYHESISAQNLLDLLRMLKALGLRANLSLRPGTPMQFEWDKIREIITYYRLWEHDIVFAFDLAWEPSFGNHDERKEWDEAWRNWILERYGSVENAERDWEYPAPRDPDGAVTNPLNEWLLGDGPYRRVVAAYRRFLDTLLYEKYSKARDLVRSVDPHHLISFRMAEAGNPTFRWDKVIPYDFPYLAGAVDFLAPEAYGRIGDWERVKPGWFEREYARWAAPGKPMIWAEAGVNAWVESRGEAPQDRLAFQGDFYRNLYRMFTESAADGIFFWWYPGGYRVNERSDYGIINPDGTDRPNTQAIRALGKDFMEGHSLQPPNHWIAFDRDRYPEGIAGVYDEVQKEFWEAIAAGRVPGLKTAGTGTTSATCPLTAVGGTDYNGNNPLKFLDGFFDAVSIQESGSDPVRPLGKNSVIRFGSWQHIQLICRVTNLGEATWLPGSSGIGGVCMVIRDDAGTELLRAPLQKPLARFETAVVKVRIPRKAINNVTKRLTMSLEAINRARFGPKFTFEIAP